AAASAWRCAPRRPAPRAAPRPRPSREIGRACPKAFAPPLTPQGQGNALGGQAARRSRLEPPDVGNRDGVHVAGVVIEVVAGVFPADAVDAVEEVLGAGAEV